MGYFEERAEALRREIGGREMNNGGPGWVPSHVREIVERNRAAIEAALREVGRELAERAVLRARNDGIAESPREIVDALLSELDAEPPREGGWA